MKNKFLIFILIIFSTVKLDAQDLLNEEQQEFVDIIKVILKDKDVNDMIKKNNLISNNKLYILNENTPLEGFIYSEQSNKKRIVIFSTKEELFFNSVEKFISVIKYSNNENHADLELMLNQTKMNFTLEKIKPWKLVRKS